MTNQYEIELRCLAGKPIILQDNLFIHKVSLSEVLDLGYSNYNTMINLLCMDKDELIKSLNIDTSDNVDVYKYIISVSAHVVEEHRYEELSVFYNLINVLSSIFKEKVEFNPYIRNFKVGDKGTLQRSNFEEFQQILKIRNCLSKSELENDNPDSERTRQLLERRKQLREKVHKAKRDYDDDDGITLFDLISIYSEASHMKLEDVFNYDLFQFNDQFNRLKIFMDYNVNIRAILAGAKQENIDVQHWLSKIKKTE